MAAGVSGSVRRSGAYRSTRRYARAIFDYVKGSASALETLIGDLRSFRATLDKNPPLGCVLSNPAFSVAKRKQVVSDLVLRLKLGDDSRRILGVLMAADRLEALGDIIEAVKDLWLKSLNRVALHFESASELSIEQKKMVVSQFGILLGRPVEPEFIVSPALIGGFRAQVDGKRYDGSIISWFRAFHEKNAGGT